MIFQLQAKNTPSKRVGEKTKLYESAKMKTLDSIIIFGNKPCNVPNLSLFHVMIFIKIENRLLNHQTIT